MAAAAVKVRTAQRVKAGGERIIENPHRDDIAIIGL